MFHLFSVTTLKTTELFDGTSWTDGPDLPEKRYAHAVVSYHWSKLFFFSGFDAGVGGLGHRPTTYEYDLGAQDKGWVRKADMPQPGFTMTFGHIRSTVHSSISCSESSTVKY